MCGPSSSVKNIDAQIQAFTQQVTNEAVTAFGSANRVFNSIMSSAREITRYGKNQLGFGTAEDTTRKAAIVQQSAEAARAGSTAARTAIAAVGGGNVVTPGGTVQQAALATTAAEQERSAQAKSEEKIANLSAGREDFWKALAAEPEAMEGYNKATEFNKEATKAQDMAMTSATTVSAQENVVQNAALKAGMSLLSGPSVQKAIGGLKGGGDSGGAGGVGGDSGGDSGGDLSVTGGD